MSRKIHFNNIWQIFQILQALDICQYSMNLSLYGWSGLQITKTVPTEKPGGGLFRPALGMGTRSPDPDAVRHPQHGAASALLHTPQPGVQQQSQQPPVLSPSDTPHPPKPSKPESQKVFWSRARQHIEEMVEKDFLEGLIKT